MVRGQARVIRPDREQPQWDMIDLEALLPADHRARMVWGFVEQLDLTPLYDAVGAREGEAGRPPPDPAVLLALWLYATLDNVGSARELARRSQRDIAYRWLTGGVPLNHHGLSDFRVEKSELIDRLLTESVAALMAEGLVDLDEIIIDGTKVQASAGKGSFVGSEGLAKAEQLAAARVTALKTEIDADPAASTRRQRAAAARAAREIGERAAQARAALERLRAEKAERAKTHAKAEAEKGEPKVSLTDPEARFMRFADGSVKPGYNMPVAATNSGLVVAVSASDRRNDSGLAVPMIDEIERRYGRVPERLLIDTNCAPAEDILAFATRTPEPIVVYAPPPSERDDVKPETLKRRAAERAKEAEPLKEWRARMATAEAKIVYSRRKRIELINAQFKNRGFGRLALRGLAKAKIVATWHALAHNILVAARLRLAASSLQFAAP